MRSPSINTWILLPIIVYPLNHAVPCESLLCIPGSLQGCLAFYQTVPVLAGNGYLWASRWYSCCYILSLAVSSALLFPSLSSLTEQPCTSLEAVFFIYFVFLPLIPYLRNRSKSSVNKVGWKTRCLQFPTFLPFQSNAKALKKSKLMQNIRITHEVYVGYFNTAISQPPKVKHPLK